MAQSLIRSGTRERPAALRVASLFGPALVASVAYVDPGNVATNFQSGAEVGYRLVWVVVLSSAMAMLVQYLAAKLGIVTGKGLARLCGERLAVPARWAFWLQAEVMAAATDLAEVVGTAVGLRLLFGVPLAWGALAGGVLAFAVLAVRRRGYRAFELCIAALLAVVVLAFVLETVRLAPSPSATAAGLIPRLGGHTGLLLAIGIIGATVMPHAIYLHSHLATDRRTSTGAERGRLLGAERVDVLGALGVAGAANVAMLLVAAALFGGHSGADTLLAAHAGLVRAAGGAAALAYSIALLASGLSSAAVGTYAGQVVMEGLTPWRLPMWARRAVSVVPAVALLVWGVGPTTALVLSQVVLGFGVPFALVPLVHFTASRPIMGRHVNRPVVTALAIGLGALVTALDLWLVVAG